MPALESVASSTHPALIVVAAPAEARAVLRATSLDPETEISAWSAIKLPAPHEHLELLLTGIGKANAAAGLVAAFDPPRHSAVINVGVAGMLPTSGLALGQAVLATQSVYADEGGITPNGFVDIAEMGFPPDLLAGTDTSIGKDGDSTLIAVLTPLTQRQGNIATVSTCSGTDDFAWEIANRTGAIAECMEGAALAFTAAQLKRADATSLPFAEIRTISNTTGNRDSQQWNLKSALDQLTELVNRL
ncbi:MAG: futalosine hydrolase [Planctomycetota bacterium]